MGQTTSKNTKNHKNKRKSISKLFHAQTGSIWFQMCSYLVPLGSYGSQIGSYKLKRVPNSSHAHALFQDRFKDVQVGSSGSVAGCNDVSSYSALVRRNSRRLGSDVLIDPIWLLSGPSIQRERDCRQNLPF